MGGVTVTDDFFGLDKESLVELGKIAVGGGLLERVTRDIANAVFVTPAKLPFSAVIDLIRERCQDIGVPAWSTTEPSEVLVWCQRARQRMEERHRMLHSAFFQRYTGEAMVVHFESMKDGRGVRRFDAVRINKDANKIRAVVNDGHRIEQGLLPVMAPGVYVRCLPPGEAAQGVIRTVDGVYPPRPADADIVAFALEFDKKLIALGGGVPFRK